MHLKSEYDRLIEQQNLLKDTPRQLSILEKKEAYYDSILSKYQLKGTSIQTNLLKTINAHAESNNLKVVTFMEPHLLQEGGLTIKMYQFSLEGNYNAIINLVHKLEQETKFGEIINLHFEKKQNFRTGKEYLQAKFLLKSIEGV